MSNASATDNTKDYYFEEKLSASGGYKSWRGYIYQDCVVFTDGGGFF